MRAYLAAVLIALSVIGSTLVVAIETEAGGSESGEFPNRTFTVSKGLLSKSDKTDYTATIDPTIDCTWYVELVELGGASVKMVVLNESDVVLSSSKLTDVGSESEQVSLIGGSAYHVTFSYVGKRGTSVLVERTGGMPVPTTPHAPILISSNADFTYANGVVSGSGALGDPYVIEGWDIDASTSNGIEITNTDAYFIVRNCLVHDGGWSSYGISLSFCSNGILDSNDCTNNLAGIRLLSSDNNKISNNSCSANRDAMKFESSSYNMLSNNDCSNNLNGVAFKSSNHYNTLANNILNSNNFWGVCLGSSNYNTLIDNICISNFQSGICLQSSSNNVVSNNTCTSSYYYGIDLQALSTYNTIVENSCSSNNQAGICIGASSNNALRNNNCSSNYRDGICLFLSDGNEMTQNLISNNIADGVNVSSGSNNRVWDNIFVGNNGSGSAYDPSHVQALDDGLNNRWNSDDGQGNYWRDWTSPDTNGDGIVDVPYAISGSDAAMDNYPQVNPPL